MSGTPVLTEEAVRLDAVLEAVEFPAGVAHLDAGLADVHADAFPLQRKETTELRLAFLDISTKNTSFNRFK